MNLSKVNLNLLKALDALLNEQHVTRAGEKLFLTQSAVSNLLKQLREIFMAKNERIEAKCVKISGE